MTSAAKDGKSNVVVSIKSAKQKRKASAGQTATEIYDQEFGDSTRKKAKKGKKGK